MNQTKWTKSLKWLKEQKTIQCYNMFQWKSYENKCNRLEGVSKIVILVFLSRYLITLSPPQAIKKAQQYNNAPHFVEPYLIQIVWKGHKRVLNLLLMHYIPQTDTFRRNSEMWQLKNVIFQNVFKTRYIWNSIFFIKIFHHFKLNIEFAIAYEVIGKTPSKLLPFNNTREWKHSRWEKKP